MDGYARTDLFQRAFTDERPITFIPLMIDECGDLGFENVRLAMTRNWWRLEAIQQDRRRIGGALEAADIEALVTADDAGGLQPGLWMGEGVRVLVRAEDAERAKEILGGSS